MKFFKIFSVVSLLLLFLGIVLFIIGMSITVSIDSDEDVYNIGDYLGISALMSFIFSVPLCIICGIISTAKNKKLNNIFLPQYKAIKNEIYNRFKVSVIDPFPQSYGNINAIFDATGFCFNISNKYTDEKGELKEISTGIFFDRGLLEQDYEGLLQRFDRLNDLETLKRSLSHILYRYLSENAKGFLFNANGELVSEEVFLNKYFHVSRIGFSPEATDYHVFFGILSLKQCSFSEDGSGIKLDKETLILKDSEHDEFEYYNYYK